MDGAMLGVVALGFLVLLAPSLGWSARDSQGLIVASAILFALGIALPTAVAVEREPGWILGGGIATGLGAICLVFAVLSFRRVGREPFPRPRKRRSWRPGGAPEAPSAPGPSAAETAEGEDWEQTG